MRSSGSPALSSTSTTRGRRTASSPSATRWPHSTGWREGRPMPDTTCPVAELGRRAAAMIQAFRLAEERESGLPVGSERFQIERFARHLGDHQDAVQEYAAGVLAESAEGALFQLFVAYTEVDSLRDLVGGE